MSVKNAGPDTGTRFNYLVCLDIIVLACILVVAGRPDGLAITLSAIIVATGAVCYRCSVGVKSYLSEKPRKTGAGQRHVDQSFRPPPQSAPAASDGEASAGRKSWLREAEE